MWVWIDPIEDKFRELLLESLVEKGGPGSGNFGHSGRPGAIGGSSSGGGGGSKKPSMRERLDVAAGIAEGKVVDMLDKARVGVGLGKVFDRIDEAVARFHSGRGAARGGSRRK